MNKKNKEVQMFKAEYTVHEMAMIRRSMEHYLSDYVNATHGFESPEGQQEEKDIIKKWLKDDFHGRLLKGATKIADFNYNHKDGKITMTKNRVNEGMKVYLPKDERDAQIDKIAQKEFGKNYSELNDPEQFFCDDAYACSMGD